MYDGVHVPIVWTPFLGGSGVAVGQPMAVYRPQVNIETRLTLPDSRNHICLDAPHHLIFELGVRLARPP